MRTSAREREGEPTHELKENPDKERKPGSLLRKRSLKNVLDRLDAHETFEVSCDIRRRK